MWNWRTKDAVRESNLLWTLEKDGMKANGIEYLRFRNVTADMCLDRGGLGNGADVILWTCNESASQYWYFDKAGLLRSMYDSRCLDVEDTQWREGAVLQMWDCRSTWDRRWYLTYGFGPS